MMGDDLSLRQICDRLGLEDPMGFLHGVVHILSDVYAMNAARHDESVGDDMATFAQLIYRNSWAQLEQRLPESDSSIWTSRPDNSLVIDTPGPRIKVYRAGSTDSFDIEAFDCTTGSIAKQQFARQNALQLSLFAASPDEGVTTDQRLDSPNWVVLHAGNPEDGLVRAWIGAPANEVRPGTQNNWLFVHSLPDLCAEYGCTESGGGHGGLSVEAHPLGPQGPSFDALPEPEIRVAPRSRNG